MNKHSFKKTDHAKRKNFIDNERVDGLICIGSVALHRVTLMDVQIMAFVRFLLCAFFLFFFTFSVNAFLETWKFAEVLSVPFLSRMF